MEAKEVVITCDILSKAQEAIEQQDFAALAKAAHALVPVLAEHEHLLGRFLLICDLLGKQYHHRSTTLDLMMDAVRILDPGVVRDATTARAEEALRALVDYALKQELLPTEGVAALLFAAARTASLGGTQAASRLRSRAAQGVVEAASVMPPRKDRVRALFYAARTLDLHRKYKVGEGAEPPSSKAKVIKGLREAVAALKDIREETAVLRTIANSSLPGSELESVCAKAFIELLQAQKHEDRLVICVEAIEKPQRDGMFKSFAIEGLLLQMRHIPNVSARMPLLYLAAENASAVQKPDVIDAILNHGLLQTDPNVSLSACFFVIAGDDYPASGSFSKAVGTIITLLEGGEIRDIRTHAKNLRTILRKRFPETKPDFIRKALERIQRLPALRQEVLFVPTPVQANADAQRMKTAIANLEI